jgi:hypothetical protein
MIWQLLRPGAHSMPPKELLVNWISAIYHDNENHYYRFSDTTHILVASAKRRLVALFGSSSFVI